MCGKPKEAHQNGEYCKNEIPGKPQSDSVNAMGDKSKNKQGKKAKPNAKSVGKKSNGKSTDGKSKVLTARN